MSENELENENKKIINPDRFKVISNLHRTRLMMIEREFDLELNEDDKIESEKFKYSLEAEIKLTPEQVKNLYLILGEALKGLQEEYGEIREKNEEATEENLKTYR